MQGAPLTGRKLYAALAVIVAAMVVTASVGIYYLTKGVSVPPAAPGGGNGSQNGTTGNVSIIPEPSFQVGQFLTDATLEQLLQKYAGSVLLGMPTDRSVAVNILAPKGMEAYVEHGAAAGSYTKRTQSSVSVNGEPVEIILNGLSPGTTYHFRARWKFQGSSDFRIGQDHNFTTQRPAGSSFVFAIEADPHMDENSDGSVWAGTLRKMAADSPDFVLDLGDTFMTEKFAKTQDEVNRRYVELRTFFDIAGGSSPLFLVSGNHDSEVGWLFNASQTDNKGYWSLAARKAYYPTPSPDSFYTGSSAQDQAAGLHENYYAWTWGDALFITLDPYTYTPKKPPQDDQWGWTLGEAQYAWLKVTLEKSSAKYKFVFLHHVNAEGRGMTKLSGQCEWGGNNSDGTWGFDSKRPGWEMPIHQLMAKHGVTAVFQGHDHFFCKEEKDGIVYQEVPQPSNAANKGNVDGTIAAQYTGTPIANAGYLRVTVTPSSVTVDYVRTSPASSAGTAASYTM